MRKILNFLDKWGLFSLVVLAWFIFQAADLGELVFLFIYENVCALLGLLFYLFTVDAFFVAQRSATKGLNKFLAPFANVGIYLFYFGGLFLFILFINQVSIELLLAYMCPTGNCTSDVLQILQNDFFLSAKNLGALSNSFPMGFTSFTILVIGFTFFKLSVQAYDNRKIKNNAFGMLFFLQIAASATAMAISVLAVSLVWTLFNEFAVVNKLVYIGLLILLRIIYLQLMSWAENMLQKSLK